MKNILILGFLLISTIAFGGRQKHIRQTEQFHWEVGSGSADSSAVTGTTTIFIIPANTVILDVRANIETAVTGSTAETVGDDGDANGYLEDGFAASTGYPKVSALSTVNGAYMYEALESGTSTASKFYSSADTLDWVISGTSTAGKIRFFIDYMRVD